MAKHVHICLVSEQTIPNVFGIYHFKPDKVIFYTTEAMEDKGMTDCIINTLKIYGLDYSRGDQHERIIVNQDSFRDCKLKMEDSIRCVENKHITVNLTGGTKLMMLAAYNVFEDLARELMYIPINSNEFVAISSDEEKKEQLELRLSVEAYVTAYGAEIANRGKLDRSKDMAREHKGLCEWMINNYKAIEGILEYFSNRLRNKRGSREEVPFKVDNYSPNASEKELLKRVGFSETSFEKRLNRHEIRFLTGDWLSEFCFNEIEKLDVDDCALEVHLKKGNRNNEFDVLFVKNNAMYIIECKTLAQGHDKGTDILYKIRALQREFGLRVRGFLVSTAEKNIICSKTRKIKNSLRERAEAFNTTIIHPDNIKELHKVVKI